MTHWAPVPLAINDDPRVRLRPVVEQLTLVRLYLIAKGADLVPMPPLRSEAPHAIWRRMWGGEMAEAIGLLVEAGLVTVEPVGLRLALPTGMRAAAPQGGPPRYLAGGGPGGAAEGAEEHSVPPPSVVAARTRKLKFNFNGREGELAIVPAGVTWEAWIETPEGLEVYARRVLGQGKTERARGAGGTFQRSSGTRSDGTTGTPSEHHGNGQRNAPPKLSETSSLVEKGREERGTERHRNGTGRNATGTDHRNALDALRAAVAGRATLTGAASLEQEFAGLLTRHALTGEELARVGVAFEDPSAWWPKGKNPAPAHVTLNDLAGFRGDAGYEWRAVAALVGHVRAPRRTPAAARPRAGAPPPPPPPSARAGEEAVRAAARAVNAPPKETTDA